MLQRWQSHPNRGLALAAPEPHAVLGIRIGERIIHLLGEDMATNRVSYSLGAESLVPYLRACLGLTRFGRFLLTSSSLERRCVNLTGSEIRTTRKET